ncbi:MAG: GNAT family N-acetyltransferase, partial [Thermotogota bacterium]|nr:GNAT family N-acetyltransferase [Thermotogota bacterium]
FPGMLVRWNIAGVPLNCFSYANNDHSFRGGIIARKDDISAIHAAIYAATSSLGARIHILSLPRIMAESLNHHAITSHRFTNLSVHIEHSFESPSFDISGGMDSYLATRSGKFRKRIKQGLNRAKRLGSVEYDIVKNMENPNEIVKRLKSLDRKTWQHQNGTGLFSTTENLTFYSALIHDYSEGRPMIVCFLKIDGVDAAYELATSFGSTAFFLKYGYDPAFNKCSPGLLIQTHLSRYVSSLGFKEVDLLGETTTEKARWATHFCKHSNYWFINRRTARGIYLHIALSSQKIIKNIIKHRHLIIATQKDNRAS